MAATSTSDATPAACTTATGGDGPVLNVITKRLRALRKKHNRIIQMEESLAQGKTLNKEQQDVLRSKSSVVVLIDELEKLRAPLSAAVQEELSLTASATPASPQEAEERPLEPQEEQLQQLPPPASDDGDAIKDLLNLMYFGSLFDVKPQSEFTSLMLTRTHERGCCLTYDYVTDDATDLLRERDLDLISALQTLMLSRPLNSTLSHQNALVKCTEYAKRWLAKSDDAIDPDSSVTYAGLREKLNKIMASDYFTATPQMTGPGEVVAAAAVGNFGSFQVPMHESIVSVEVPVQVDGSVGQYHETEENATNFEEYETDENQSSAVEESQKEDLERENSPEVVSTQAEQEQLQAEGEDHRHAVDFREQQYAPRRGQRGGRGGRRGGYPNGRGGRGSSRGGPYQNGRSQYYENYYPRTNYYNRRGGRGSGGGGGGNSYYNHSSAAQGNHAQANVGVAS